MLITCRRASEVAIQQAREESWAEVLLAEDTQPAPKHRDVLGWCPGNVCLRLWWEQRVSAWSRVGQERSEQGRGRDDARKVDWGQRRKKSRLFLGWGMRQRAPRVCLNTSDDGVWAAAAARRCPHLWGGRWDSLSPGTLPSRADFSWLGQCFFCLCDCQPCQLRLCQVHAEPSC